jgi:hypothetical protein
MLKSPARTLILFLIFVPLTDVAGISGSGGHCLASASCLDVALASKVAEVTEFELFCWFPTTGIIENEDIRRGVDRPGVATATAFSLSSLPATPFSVPFLYFMFEHFIESKVLGSNFH